MADKFKKTLAAIDDAIVEHIRANRGDNSTIVTGWITIIAVTDSTQPNLDNYVVQASTGMPHHAQVGLLSMAVDDKKNLGIIATLHALMQGDDDD